jgi:signal transduction histidine kinase
MGKVFKKIKDGFDLKKQADELGLRVWQTPSFLFLLMGIVIVAAMTGVFFISQLYDDPAILVISESLVVMVLLTIGNSIIGDIEMMAKTNKMRSEFVSIASHQLKTPLSEISWEVELLLSKNNKGLNEKQLALISNIFRANNRMKKLVNDLLDVSRIEQGKLILVKEKFDIVKVARDVAEESKILASIKGAEIKVKAGNKIAEIIGDKRRIGVVIENLVSNAVKYIGAHGKIEVGLANRENGIIIWVKDNGIGIPKNQQGKVFQKFFRAENTARYQTDGTGLGLYIAKNVVEQAGGKIWFVSEEGSGANFFFTLPTAENV